MASPAQSQGQLEIINVKLEIKTQSQLEIINVKLEIKNTRLLFA